MTRILALAAPEFRIGLRNRWLAIAMALTVLFALVLTAAGSGPTGSLGAGRLSVTVASLTSLSVYLVPLMARLMSFDAVAGEVERGTLPLILTYPVARGQILAGKALAHLVILSLAMVAGYGAAGVMALAFDTGAATGLPALARLIVTSIAPGATFPGLGYAISSRNRCPSGSRWRRSSSGPPWPWSLSAWCAHETPSGRPSAFGRLPRRCRPARARRHDARIHRLFMPDEHPGPRRTQGAGPPGHPARQAACFSQVRDAVACLRMSEKDGTVTAEAAAEIARMEAIFSLYAESFAAGGLPEPAGLAPAWPRSASTRCGPMPARWCWRPARR